MSEWDKFTVGNPALRGFNTDCMPFDSVSHTSHVASAISIIDAGEIRPSLVSDTSKLNDKRILVSWLSPNDWGPGFRYGNVRFNFSFNKLIQSKQCYWVESIAYKTKACRILITDMDRDHQLKPYDPTAKTGPWWFDTNNDQHYFNGMYCIEFMIEAPIKLDQLTKLDFVKHHAIYCSAHRYNANNCAELGLDSSKGAALFLTRAAVSGLDLSDLSVHFVKENVSPTTELENGFYEFAVRISRKVTFTGTLTERSKYSVAVMRGIMSAFTFGSKEESKLLCAMFQSETSFINVAAMVIADTVGLKQWEKLADVP